MHIAIDTEILDKYNISLEEFALLLYYIDGKSKKIDLSLCEKLWNKNYLIKTEEGYSLNGYMMPEIESWIAQSMLPKPKVNNLNDLANKMREIYPEGKKPGTEYYWRDSTKIIAQRLSVFFKKYGEYSDEDILNATKKYVEAFNGDYKYMHLLKYFISKKNTETKEDSSELLSYIENKNDTSQVDWNVELK